MKSMWDADAVRVRVAHEEALITAGLAAVLAGCGDLVVHADGDGAPVDDAVHDVVITSQQRALQLLATRGARGSRVMVVATAARPQELRQAIDAGVHGFVLTSSSGQEFCSAVRTLVRGLRYICPQAAQLLVDGLNQAALTGREMEVLRLLVTGSPNKAIARDLAISLGTVKSHVKAILQKLDATSRTQATSVAIQRGLIGDAAEADAPAAVWNRTAPARRRVAAPEALAA